MISIIAIVGNILLFVLVFAMSATVDINSMKQQLCNYQAFIVGCTAQFIILPLLGFIIVKSLSSVLPYTIGIMVLVVTSSPGGSYSNWWCSMFNADLALSVTMTAISTVMSIIILPFNLLIYTKFTYHSNIVQELDWNSLFIALSIVISAIVLGLFCSYYIHNRSFQKLSNTCGNIAGILLMIFSATMSNTNTASNNNNSNNNSYEYNEEQEQVVVEETTRIWNRPWYFYVAVIVPAIGGLIITTIIASYCTKIKKPERVTVAIESCYQNVGIATSLALTMFQDKPKELAEAISVPFMYGLVEMILIGIYCIICWKLNWTKAPANESLWKVITTSYEVLEQEQRDLHSIEIIEISTDKKTVTTNNNNNNNKMKDIETDYQQLDEHYQNRGLKESSSQDGGTFTTYFGISRIIQELIDPHPDDTTKTEITTNTTTNQQ